MKILYEILSLKTQWGRPVPKKIQWIINIYDTPPTCFSLHWSSSGMWSNFNINFGCHKICSSPKDQPLKVVM